MSNIGLLTKRIKLFQGLAVYQPFIGTPHRHVGESQPDGKPLANITSFYSSLGKEMKLDKWGIT